MTSSPAASGKSARSAAAADLTADLLIDLTATPVVAPAAAVSVNGVEVPSRSLRDLGLRSSLVVTPLSWRRPALSVTRSSAGMSAGPVSASITLG